MGGFWRLKHSKKELLELAANFADLVSAAPALMRQWSRDAVLHTRQW